VFSLKSDFADCEKDSNLLVQDLEKTPGGEFFQSQISPVEHWSVFPCAGTRYHRQ
jgi:hypothetical protein